MKQEIEEGIAGKTSPTVLKIYPETKDVIKRHSPFGLTAFEKEKGVWALGYGSTHYSDSFPVLEGEDCTMENADEMLQNDIDIISYMLNNFLIKNKLIISRGQFSALVSLAQDIGLDPIIYKGRVHIALLFGDYIRIAHSIKSYCKETRKILGVPYKRKSIKMLNRRMEEITLFWS